MCFYVSSGGSGWVSVEKKHSYGLFNYIEEIQYAVRHQTSKVLETLEVFYSSPKFSIKESLKLYE